MPRMPIKRDYIINKVKRLQIDHSLPLELDWLHNKPRLGIIKVIGKKFGIDRYISDRLSKKDFATWLDGFSEGLELIRTQTVGTPTK